MSKKSKDNSAKRLARLAAVQGLYQLALTGHSSKQIIQNFRDHPGELLQEGADSSLGAVDQELFADIVNNVTLQEKDLDAMLAGAFDAKLSADRIEILLRAILRAGAYELHHHAVTPANVIINDYVDVTHAFFGAKEPGLVNAVLDKLSKNLRS